MIDPEVEQQLGRLRLRGAPNGLRETVLARVADLERSQVKPQPRSRFDSCVNWVIAASIFATSVVLYHHLVVQPRQLASLLGPTAAERRAEKVVNMMSLAEDDPGRLRLRSFLRNRFQAAQDQSIHRGSLHSVVEHELLSIAKGKHHELETHYKDRAPRQHDRSDYRSWLELESSGTT
jgi:hypothetical protein